MNQTEGDIQDRNAKTVKAGKISESILNTLREPSLILNKDFNFISRNQAFLGEFQFSERELKNLFLGDLEKSEESRPALLLRVKEVLENCDSFTDIEIRIRTNSLTLETYLLNGCRIHENEEEYYLLTFQKKSKEKGENLNLDISARNFENILAHAPAMLCILRGPKYVFEVANSNYYQLIGNREIIGKTVREVIPEAEGQGFFDLLDKVWKSGKPHRGQEVPFTLIISPEEEKKSFVDFTYQPTFNQKGEIDGIFVYAVDVTEKVLARRKIEKSELELRRQIDAVPAMIWITNKEGQSLYLNDNWYRYTGQAPREAEGFGWVKAIHPDDRQMGEDAFKIANEDRVAYNVNFRLRRENGEYRWVMDRGNPKFNEQGEYEGMVGTVIDVHEEKLKEQRVRESEHRIRNIVEEATVATAIYVGKDMKIELANEAMITLWGKTPGVIGKPLREALPELEGQPFHKLLDDVFTTGNTYWGKEDKVDLEINGIIQTGYFNFTYKPLRNESGKIYGILNMAVDVTELVRSKMLVKESEMHFRQIADLMPTKVTNADASGNYIYFNQEWLEYTGLTFKELNERGWENFIHPDEILDFQRKWQSSLNSGDHFEMELRCLNKKGIYKWHLSRAEAVKNEDGSVKMWIGTTTEIQKLKEEERRKGDFLKMVSHELKTPVTSIKGYVQLLLSMIKTDNAAESGLRIPLKPSLERIDHQIRRLTRLISEMLDLSRIEENKLELQKQVFNLNDLVDETVQDILYTNTQHNIQVRHDYNCNVFADRDRIGQVLINFITNAIKYSPESQDIQLKIKKQKGNQVSVSVKDQGIGIEKKNHQNIFKRFYRIGGKDEETYSGFGIGLYLAKEIIQRHNGTIAVKSKKGKGSDFGFTLSVASEKNKI